MRGLAVIMAALLLAGCWQTRTLPYRGVAGVTPFAAGQVIVTGPDGRKERYGLSLQPRGRYRLASLRRGQQLGEGFDLALFPLPHAPSHVLIYEAAPLDHPRELNDLRYYGLLDITGARSAAEIRADCTRDWRAARVSGTRKDADGACTFATREALEKSLLALWKSHRKPQYTYSLR